MNIGSNWGKVELQYCKFMTEIKGVNNVSKGLSYLRPAVSFIKWELHNAE